MSNCLADVELIEVFFQIFTMNAWGCFHEPLHYSSGGGAPYDVCYAKKCKSHGLNAVDYRMKGYHLERSLDYLKEHNIESLELPEQKFEHTGGRGGCIGGINCPIEQLKTGVVAILMLCKKSAGIHQWFIHWNAWMIIKLFSKCPELFILTI